MALINCPECDNTVSDKAAACPKCGCPINNLQPDSFVCLECKGSVPANAETCPHCGLFNSQKHANKQETVQNTVYMPAATQQSGRNKLTAALLAIFLGGLGIHKFYLGKGTQGVVYLLFCWSLIPTVIGFIEGILYLMMSDESFSNQYK